jgi:hypothetical protein
MKNKEKNSNVSSHQVDDLLRKIEKILLLTENSLTIERIDNILEIQERFKK